MVFCWGESVCYLYISYISHIYLNMFFFVSSISSNCPQFNEPSRLSRDSSRSVLSVRSRHRNAVSIPTVALAAQRERLHSRRQRRRRWPGQRVVGETSRRNAEVRATATVADDVRRERADTGRALAQQRLLDWCGQGTSSLFCGD